MTEKNKEFQEELSNLQETFDMLDFTRIEKGGIC